MTRIAEVTAKSKWEMFVSLLQKTIDEELNQSKQDPTFMMELRNPLIGLTISSEIREGGTRLQQQLANLTLYSLREAAIDHRFSREQLQVLRLCTDLMTSETLSRDTLMAVDHLLVSVGFDSIPSIPEE